MSSRDNRDSRDGRGQQHFEQDYVCRIRYSNALPPPPMPPKLLNIPGIGIERYTTPGFGARLARRQALNIELDAELGMPLDLVGMPNIFEGDESSIQPSSQPPQLHPKDRALLRPLDALSRTNRDSEPVAFLRRTEYISSQSRPMGGGGGGPKSRPGSNLFINNKRKDRPLPADTPSAIRRKIDRSFEVADKYLNDLPKVKHPKNRNLKCVEAFPLLPDLDAFPDSGAYVTMKFIKPPMPAGSKTYDTRLLSGIMRPIQKTDEEEARLRAAIEAYTRDPQHNPKPEPNMDYNFFLTKTGTDAEKFRVKFDVDHPAREDESLYTAHGQNGKQPCFAFTRLRTYETVKETELDHERKYSHTVLLAFATDDDVEGQKGVFYYPVMQHSEIRPQRQKRIDIAHGYGRADEEQDEMIDQLEVTVADPSQKMLEKYMLRYKESPFGFADESEDEQEPQDAAADEQEEEDADGSAEDR